MKCDKINKIYNCSKCIFNYNDTTILEKTTCEQICKAISTMLFFHKYNVNSIDKEYYYTANISCTGVITILCNTYDKQPNLFILLNIYKTILYTWYTVSINSSSTNNNLYLNNKVLYYLHQIEKTYNINKIRQYSIQLVKDVEVINNSKSDNISSIESNNLSFNNLDTIAKLSCIGVVTLVYHILEKVGNLHSNVLFINLDKCSFNHEGIIQLSDEINYCESTILTAKTLYSKYLNTWCKSNFTSVQNINRLKKSIDKVNRCKDIYTIKNICYTLVEQVKQNN